MSGRGPYHDVKIAFVPVNSDKPLGAHWCVLQLDGVTRATVGPDPVLAALSMAAAADPSVSSEDGGFGLPAATALSLVESLAAASLDYALKLAALAGDAGPSGEGVN